jgi:hypothetical protein
MHRCQIDGFEPDGAEVVAGGEVNIGVEGGGEAARQGDGRLGAAFLDALDVVFGEGGPLGSPSARPIVRSGATSRYCQNGC